MSELFPSKACAESKPPVAVIVLNWNGLDDTMRCLASLDEVSWPDLNIVVIDNGSRLSPVEAIAERWPRVDVVRLPANKGYAGGNNVGFERALAQGAEFVWVLNNDTRVDPEALAHMVASAQRNVEAGVIGSKVLRGDHPDSIWVAWGRVTWRQSLIGLVGENAPDDGSFDGEHRVEWLPGCSLLFRRRALEEVGVFDENFFAYHEDVDWAARARAMSWDCVYCGSARVWHYVHGSSGGASHFGGFRKYLSARNSVLYARLHGSRYQQLSLAVSIVLSLPFQFLRRCPVGEGAAVVMKIKGWWDGLLGRPVPIDRLGLR